MAYLLDANVFIAAKNLHYGLDFCPAFWEWLEWLEREVVARDQRCVYCGLEFGAAGARRRDRASWEHIVNDARIVTAWNIARCCIGCNASKGTKALAEWLESRYCRTRGITRDSVAPVVRTAMALATDGTLRGAGKSQ